MVSSDAAKSLNVLFLETSMRVGGTETVITRLMERFDRGRVNPSVCCLYEAGPLGQKLAQAGMTVHSELSRSRWDFGLPFRLYRLLKNEKVDVLFIVNQPITQLWGTLCGVLARVPVRITAIRSTGKINRIHRRLLINRMTFPWITKVTALSRMHKAYLVKEEKINPDQIEIITNGVDLARFGGSGAGGTLRASLGIPEQVPVVGIVAMLRPEKAHWVFVKAAAEALKKVPSAHFLVVGDGPERDRLETMAEELKITPNIHFLGSRNDVADLVNLLDVAVLSSDPVVETVSNSVLEYMAVRKPVISTRVGSLPEMVDEGKTGFLIEPRDWQAMADKMVTLLSDPVLARQMGEAGREKIEHDYTVDQMVRNWEDLFERLYLGASGGSK